MWWWGGLVWALDPCAELESRMPEEFVCRSTASTARSEFVEAQASGAFGVQVRLAVSRGGRPFRFVPLATEVCNGDGLALEVMPSQQGHIFVVTQGTSGAWSKLYPADGLIPAPFAPGAPVRLPDKARNGFPISGDTGMEYITVFASQQPFTKALQQDLERLAGVLAPSRRPAQLTGRAQRAFLLLAPTNARSATVLGDELRVVVPIPHVSECGPLP